MITPAVRLTALHRAYGGVKALDGLDIDFASGTFTAVMGPSGSGKSTLCGAPPGSTGPPPGRSPSAEPS
ncbi:ATP-binding cassette domain-containing protein [Streptomyces sp. NPDC055287]